MRANHSEFGFCLGLVLPFPFMSVPMANGISSLKFVLKFHCAMLEKSSYVDPCKQSYHHLLVDHMFFLAGAKCPYSNGQLQIGQCVKVQNNKQLLTTNQCKYYLKLLILIANSNPQRLNGCDSNKYEVYSQTKYIHSISRWIKFRLHSC